MKRLLSTLVALLFVVGVAHAGWNIQQGDQNNTDWVNQDGISVPVGESGLNVLVENISTASTSYVVTDRAGKISKVYSVAYGATTVDNALLDFGVVSTAGTHTPASGGATLTIAGTGAAGDIDSLTFDLGSDSNLTVEQGQAIWVHTDGGSTGDVDAMITIVIE